VANKNKEAIKARKKRKIAKQEAAKKEGVSGVMAPISQKLGRFPATNNNTNV
jgi:hypothetical protein